MNLDSQGMRTRLVRCSQDQRESEVTTILLGVAARFAGAARHVRRPTTPMDINAFHVEGISAPHATPFFPSERIPEMLTLSSFAKAVTV